MSKRYDFLKKFKETKEKINNIFSDLKAKKAINSTESVKLNKSFSELTDLVNSVLSDNLKLSQEVKDLKKKLSEYEVEKDKANIKANIFKAISFAVGVISFLSIDFNMLISNVMIILNIFLLPIEKLADIIVKLILK